MDKNEVQINGIKGWCEANSEHLQVAQATPKESDEAFPI